MTSSLDIRKAESTDTAEVARLCNLVGYSVTAKAIVSGMEQQVRSERFFTAVAQDSETTLTGSIAAERRVSRESGPWVEIVALVVDARARRNGIGRALVNVAENWAAEQRVPAVIVRSNAIRVEAHEFCPALGYYRVKTQHMYAKRLDFK